MSDFRGDETSPKAALAGRASSRPLVLLVHQPKVDWVAEQVAAIEPGDESLGLVISGHTHGGQTWPMHAITRLAFSYFSGLYRLPAPFLVHFQSY